MSHLHWHRGIYPHEWAYNTLAVDLGMSPSEVHAAVKRSVKAGLTNHGEFQIQPNISRLEELLVYGIQYIFVPDRGELTRGMPTAFAAKPLLGKIVMLDEPAPVWPDPEGPERGQAFSPLYKSVPKAARKDAISTVLIPWGSIRFPGWESNRHPA